MNIFTYVKQHVSILEVIGEYTTLKQAGTYYKACCPFHHEKTASFTVSPDKDIFYCFGCHLTGDVISFMAKQENCTQLEAAKLLAERHNLTLPETISFESEDTQKKHAYFSLCKEVALWTHEQLLKNPHILKYFEKRGFSKETIDHFGIGYFPGGQRALSTFIRAMQTKGLLAKDLLEANIVIQGKSVMYSPFEDRLIFPIKDHLSRHCAFGGRIYKPEDQRAKYYNSRENAFFVKGSVLFGLDLAKNHIKKSETAFLVEGYTDCMAMIEHGYFNTVATLGTACTIHHLQVLSRYAHTLYILYDSDNAGHQAILRLTQLCWQANMELKVIALPTGQDPASFLRSHATLDQEIAKAQDIFLFFIQSLGSNFETQRLHEKLQNTRKLLHIIQKVQDPLKQDLLLQTAAHTFNMPFNSLKQELERTQEKNQEKNKPLQKPNPPSDSDVSVLEKKIFCAILNNTQLLKMEEQSYLIRYMPNPLSNILLKIQKILLKGGDCSFSSFFPLLNEDEKKYVSRLLLEYDQPVSIAAFKQLLVQFHKRKWKHVVHTIKTNLELAKRQGDQKKIETILRDFLELKKKIIPNITQEPNKL